MIALYIEKMPDLVNNDSWLVWRGRFLSTAFLLQSDSTPYYVQIERGRIENIQRGPVFLRPWSFSVKAPEDAWLKHWEAVPEPGWHDIFAMAKIGEAEIEGDLHPMMANLRYVKEVLSSPRAIAGPGHEC